MELIQYTPRTETTFGIPVVFIQPWINKYYILDMTEEKSLVAYLLNQGFTVFIVSWKNPSGHAQRNFRGLHASGRPESHRGGQGDLRAEQVHAVGYCIGGNGSERPLAYLNKGPKEVSPFRSGTSPCSPHWSIIFPGELEVLVTEEFVKIIEEAIEKEGYLDKQYMSAAFRGCVPTISSGAITFTTTCGASRPPNPIFYSGTATRPACRRRCALTICVSSI